MKALPLLLFSLLALGCGADEDIDDSRVCVCGPSGCPEGVCNIAVELPEACSNLWGVAKVFVDDREIGEMTSGERFETCEQTVDAGTAIELRVRAAAQDFATPRVSATCEGGSAVEPTWCTLRFDLASSCEGVRESAEVVVDSQLLGEVRVGEPLIPCLLLEDGDIVTGTIRTGDIVLTAPMQCFSANSQPRLIMECEEGG
jgi:hypothetical protein